MPIRLIALFFIVLLPGAALAAAPAAPAGALLPPPAVSEHVENLPGRTLHFTATAGSVVISGPDGKPEAAIATIAYTLDGADPKTRPVTFVFNGGPGDASGWLQLGAVGPWRIRLAAPGDTANGVPSAAPALLPNADTWLDFTDLVFVDPAGTGYSRILASGTSVRRRLWSVDGDIDSLAGTIRRWLEQEGRVGSPKFLLGESYGGFRVPRLLHALAEDQGIGIRGLIMISPALDFGGSSAFDPMYWVERLPTMVAVARAQKGPVDRAMLSDVEAYAVGGYLSDLIAGPSDPAARNRLAAAVSKLTGLDSALVSRKDGRVDTRTFLREISPGNIASAYDATLTDPDAFPGGPAFREPDPLFRLTAPVTSAMLILYREHLHWRPASEYRLFNPEVTRDWNWGHGLAAPQSVTALREDLALDPQLHVLIGHGLFDLVTPYFKTVLILRHLPEIGFPGRIRLVTFEGGHMFYSRALARTAFRADARQLIAGE